MVIVPEAKSDCSRRGAAEVRIINFKTPWSEFQIPSQNTHAASTSSSKICIPSCCVHLNNYFDFHVCLSIRPSVLSVPFRPFRSVRPSHWLLTPVSAVGSQNVTNRSFLVCVKSEKYALRVTLRPLGSIRQGEPEIHAIRYCTRGSRAELITLTSVSHYFPVLVPSSCVH